MCAALLKDSAVMQPLLEFTIRNAAEEPQTDIEWLATHHGEALFSMLTRELGDYEMFSVAGTGATNR